MGNLISQGVVRIKRECAAVVAPVWAASDFFNKLNRALWVADAARRVAGVVASPGHVIELVIGFPGPRPNPETEIFPLWQLLERSSLRDPGCYCPLIECHFHPFWNGAPFWGPHTFGLEM